MIFGIRRSYSAAACFAALAALVLTAAPSVASGGPATHKVPGIGGRIDCLSAKFCLLVGYNKHGVGDVVALTNGVPGKVSVVKHSQAINLISCVPGSGCVAIGRTSNDVGTLVVPIDKHGKVGKAETINTKAGVNIAAISCTKATACGVAGNDTLTTPASIETGTWNGKKFTLHKSHGIKGASITDIAGISCAGADCTVVGYVSPTITAFSFTTKHGKAGPLHKRKNDLYDGVDCATKVLCYAVGTDQAGGFVLTLKHGKATKAAHVSPALSAIACRRNACTAVGQQLSPQGSTQAFDGSIVPVLNGAPKATIVVKASQGFQGVAIPASGHYIAAGEGAAGIGTTVVTLN